MKMAKKFLPVAQALLALVTVFACPPSKAADKADGALEERPVEYKRIGVGEYQNFLKNWDETKQPVCFALLQSPAQYGALFAPAPVMGKKRPFAPDKEVFAKEQILVVARVIAMPENLDKVFEVDRLVEKGQTLEFVYRFNAPKTGASFSVKDFLAVRIPKRDYQKVVILENGKPVGELKPAEGLWAVPAATPESGKAVSGEGK